MGNLKPAPEGQPTSNVLRMLQYSANRLRDWEYEVAIHKRNLATAEREVEREKENVKLFEYQLQLRQAQGRDD